MSWRREAALAGLIALAPAATAQEEDFGGLPPGPGQEEVYYICNACHSLAIVRQQRLPRARWEYLMEWMVDKQGMAELDAETEAVVVDYLTANFGHPGG